MHFSHVLSVFFYLSVFFAFQGAELAHGILSMYAIRIFLCLVQVLVKYYTQQCSKYLFRTKSLSCFNMFVSFSLETRHETNEQMPNDHEVKSKRLLRNILCLSSTKCFKRKNAILEAIKLSKRKWILFLTTLLFVQKKGA